MNIESWISLNKAFKKETDMRDNIDTKRLCSYGIEPLDDSLVCMAKNELVVIGADSGTGKSELCLNIARENMKKGKKVGLFYLEGGYIEAIQRLKWTDLAAEYYENYSDMGIKMDFKSWAINKNEGKRTLMEIENTVWEKYKNEYNNNLLLYASKGGLDVDKFTSSLLELARLAPNESGKGITAKVGLDLIIIDHLQYFSLMKAESEIFEITKILRAVKNITDNLKIPVVLISHLRKKGKDRGLPGQEDFYGSSNIPKIATTAITIANDSENYNMESGIYPTYIRVVKSRIGIKSNYAFLIDFNLFKRSYANNYKICKLDSFGHPKKDDTTEKTEEPKPYWHRKDTDE